MKKYLFFAAALVCATAINAKVWRINYDTNAKADFRTIAAACAATKVADSDTLYCEAGYHAGSAADNQISRSGMTVMGPGWGFEANYGNTTTISEARFSNYLYILANNVKITGLVCNRIIIGTGDSGSTPFNHYSNITIEKCHTAYINWRYGYSGGVLSNCYIRNCFITQLIELFGSSSSAAIQNIYFEGNIMHCQSNNSWVLRIVGNIDKVTNVNILHNTIICNISSASSNAPMIQTFNTLIQDNILINTANQTYVMDFSQTGNIIRKNVFSLSSEEASAVIDENYPDNYYVGATLANTFTCTSNPKYRTEEYYQLLETTPAKNAAYDGSDCGAFGGTSPYIICGRPQGIPYIYDVEVPAQPVNNQLHVTFKVAGQNE